MVLCMCVAYLSLRAKNKASEESLLMVREDRNQGGGLSKKQNPDGCLRSAKWGTSYNYTKNFFAKNIFADNYIKPGKSVRYQKFETLISQPRLARY